jgi:hypothetical protein
MSALSRWDAFLAQIESRHHGVLADGEAEGRAVIATIVTGGDLSPLSQRISAVCGRLQDLESKITDTWHAQVDDAICKEGHNEATRSRARDKGDALKHRLDDAREELGPRLHAELARQRYAYATASSRGVSCPACGATGSPPVAFRAIELTCRCGVRIPYEPGDLMRSVAAIGSHALAQEAVVNEWRAMRATERALHRYRPPAPLEPIVEHERAQITYWWSYLSNRAQFEPELGRDLAMEVRSRMDHWYRATAEYEPAWIAAGRPRGI